MRLFGFLTLLLSACTASEPMSFETGERYENAEQGYGLTQPVGWTRDLVRGSAQFAPTAGASGKRNAKHTIVVRASEKPRELKEGKPTTNEDVIAATELVLRGMPQAKLTAKSAIADARLPGARFSVTFVPPGHKQRYRRDHAVLVGTSRVFHVLYTGPAGEPVDEAAFNKMVFTLSEGV